MHFHPLLSYLLYLADLKEQKNTTFLHYKQETALADFVSQFTFTQNVW